jgi:hypothetical protein
MSNRGWGYTIEMGNAAVVVICMFLGSLFGALLSTVTHIGVFSGAWSGLITGGGSGLFYVWTRRNRNQAD